MESESTQRTHIMATMTLPETEAQESKKSTTKYVYFFGGGKADGNGKMKDVLGGKGAGLAEMTNAGLPVPPGFTIQTEACREYMRTCDLERSRAADGRSAGEAGSAAGTEARHGRESAAGERALGREVFHAGHDGHDSQPRPERQERGSAGRSAATIRVLQPTPTGG